jgi:predicted ATP-grasp superfamily ATP-dependent carboligase
MRMNHFALILGGYINGYSIVKELHENKVKNIALFDYNKSITSRSNKINFFKKITRTANSLKNALLELKEKTDFIIIFPTDDLQLENLHFIYGEIKDFCFIPFNYNNIIDTLDKYVQYSFCEKYNIPYPKTQNIINEGDINKIRFMKFPVLIKPNKRNDINTDVFRSLFLETIHDYSKNFDKIKYYLDKQITFLVSEFIPGDDTSIYAYVGYRSQKGKILNEWIGKKLNQYPDNFGVFSSASNEAPDIIKEQGRKLLEEMNLKGICQPEFKFDKRDGKYKLMEINLRSMMWHGIGNLTGVNILHTQYLDALNKKVFKQQQNRDKIIHFVYLKHEVLNLISRKGYLKFFKQNVFSSNEVYFAAYSKNDIKPFLFDLMQLTKIIFIKCLKVLKIK